MIKSLWIVGILIALSTFGVKVGLGAAAVVYSKAIPGRKKFFFLSGVILLYLLLFFSLYILTTHFRLLSYLGRFLEVLRYGMLIHIFIALGLLFWGVRLLLPVNQQIASHSHRGAFLLIFPCPICATVILLTLSLAYSLFSFPLLSTTGFLFAVFLSVSLVTILISFPFRRQIGSANSSFLGLTMIAVAIYFFFTALIAPIYQETLDVYRLASQTTGNTSLDLKSFLILLVTVTTLFSTGFLSEYRKNSNSKGVKRWGIP